ncbi:MAG: putative baseplate assembly protein [Myxococcales bacterium]|nr:putative baseplate assembly protein [Myxococcales bacterium]
MFAGAQRIDRFLYLSDPRFAGVGDSAVMRVYLGCPERGGRDLARMLEWSYWNGERWKEMTQAPIEVDRGEVAFFGPMAFAPVAVNDVEGLWLRARLAEVPETPAETELDVIRSRVEVVGEGIWPTKAYANLDNNAYLPLDLGKNIYPFGKDPKVDSTLYLVCDELLATADAYVSVEMQLADALISPSPTLPSRWCSRGSSGTASAGASWAARARAASCPAPATSTAFTTRPRRCRRAGTVSFRRPKDMEMLELNGETHRWLRIRVEKGDYGEQGTYTLENDKWIFKDDRALRPPALRNLTFHYREDYREVRYVMTFNDFEFKDVTDVARTEYTIFQPFTPKADESPALYLGFPARPPNDKMGLFFNLEEELGIGSLPTDEAAVATVELTKYEAMRKLSWESGHQVVWEYWDGREWEPLSVDDETHGFTGSGFVSMLPPDDWLSSSKFTEERFWLRARLEMGGYVKSPKVRRIYSNCIDAYNHETVRNETLGSSDGSPMQTFKFLRGPLLEEEVIEVRERQRPAAEEIADLADDAVRALDAESSQTQECWVRWRRVDSFFASSSRSRHYMLDYVTGVVQFGDGRRGMVPPENRDSIVAVSYRVGGGAIGNVNPGTLTSLGRSLAYVDSVVNPVAGMGGTDRETVDEAKARAPFTIKSRDRAVTSEDYEMLALRASTNLARSRCVPDRSNRGHVTLVVVPKGELRGEEMARRLVPSSEVLRYVKRYLDERKLVGTVLNVIPPRYQDVSLRVVLIRRSLGTSDRLRKEIEIKLRRHLHSLLGGRDGKGWEFGRPLLKSELVRVVEEVPGVEGVDALEIRDESRNVMVEHVRLDDDELPFLLHVHVTEKVRDDIR